MPGTESRYLRSLAATWGTMTLVAIVITALIFFNERNARLERAHDRLVAEAGYVQHILAAALQAGEYQQTREQIALWGSLNSETVRLDLTADNGFILGEFHRDAPGARTQQHTITIPFSYRGHATMVLEKSLEPTYLAITQLGWQLAGSIVTLQLLGIILAYQLRRYRRQVRRTQSEYDRRLEAQSALERMATLDALTGLPNRYLLDEQLTLRMAEAGRFDRKLALLFIDLDNFKNINDSFGHEAGDKLLKIVAERMAGCLRSYDLLSRFGGDEFVILLSSMPGAKQVEHVARKVFDALQSGIEVEGRELFVSASIGISIYPDDAESPSDLLRTADAAMYTAKEAGRDCYRFYTTTMNEALARRQHIEQGLRQALADGDLYLVYQPQVEIASGRICSCEALLRWRREGRQIPPGEFIPIAEQSVLMRQVQAFVIAEAVRQRAQWKRQGIADVRIDINFSGASQLISEMLPQLLQAVDDAGLSASDIGIELTEHALIDASEQTISRLSDLRGRGSTISLDDFGTGYSSLGYLKNLPVDILKIDRAFVKDLPDGRMDCAIVQAVIAMGHSMGKRVLAEGVETQAQLDYVHRQGCDLAQGFLLYRPVEASEIEPRLLRGAGAASLTALPRR
ncbi:MAG: EAL domain-containing protein [Gammaproteobacteria bacterium]|nr:EAL domain-containing protein [Gammaproteobacteria bacterium]MCP5317083.1 EAL domain-containing protein [Chromatiaceae bacterium]MCB1817765.1 EAL domain-containing protein [Gammaproteobacteria bacterium]MCP5434611.1 EAL domain-containing protein [Chromatiaceae bacterium]HOP15183.1 EAL domain-containing protein [Gammaproteobacteria bacterium]